MRILFVPMRHDDKITYSFEGDKITAIYQGQTDTFDFTGMPDGEATEIPTTLPINPIRKAYRQDGILFLELLNFHGPNPSPEVAFPEWQEVG